MTDEELKKKLRYTVNHGMFRAEDAGMKVSFSEILNRIEQLEAENARFKEALEEIAEESDSGRCDGLPEPCPAHEDVVMWLRAREALKGTDDDG
jgi:predicted nuclease with TOPRIM domain